LDGFSELANQTLPVSIFFGLGSPLGFLRISGCVLLARRFLTSSGHKHVKLRGCRALGYGSLYPSLIHALLIDEVNRGLGLPGSERGTVNIPLLGGAITLFVCTQNGSLVVCFTYEVALQERLRTLVRGIR
jgi:hypothetical protein